MSKSCCESKAFELEQLRVGQRNVLRTVLLINVLMFFVEFFSGWISRSSALTADSLDMLGDALVYGFSLYVINEGAIWRARAGLLKGYIMAAFGLFVLAQTTIRAVLAFPPVAETMGIVGGLALVANLICLALLFRHRSDDINMRSTWICSRNDILANVGTLTASLLVAATNRSWPDTIVGFTIAVVFLKSSLNVIIESKKELKLAEGH